LPGKRGRRISIFLKSTVKRINFIFPEEWRKNKRSLSLLVGTTDERRKVSTAEYLKL